MKVGKSLKFMASMVIVSFNFILNRGVTKRVTNEV